MYKNGKAISILLMQKNKKEFFYGPAGTVFLYLRTVEPWYRTNYI